MAAYIWRQNIIALEKDNKRLEPGNQIELFGAKLKILSSFWIARLFVWVKRGNKSLDVSIVSSGFDPISKLSEINQTQNKDINLWTKKCQKW